MEDFFKFILVLVGLCIAVRVGYFENTSNVPVGTVIETKISAKDKMTDKERKESERAYQAASRDCKNKDKFNESGSTLLQISHSFNFKTGSCEQAKTLWKDQDDKFWRNPTYLSKGVIVKTYTLPTNPYY
ncbi:hypothetical protein KZH41_01210 [Pseudomonas sp. YeP6b]|uniref:hypothetical protein n=1 Tax=Pseudomonas sp. YeP6b TaxID=2861775 RepID=UPI0021D81FEE|nr:hypothetical protein [Pseudomonas sp. YeP6b]UXZ22883.1 hypothetical protein KZH41_01210 [Pseudomonas sp. YeP6b]